MATIIVFRPWRGRSGAREPAVRATSAELVLFPGVRYERAADPLASSSEKSRRIKRDTIELAD